MRQKNDIAISATSARSYNRHWRANKLSWTAIGKIKYLYDGAIEYMDDVTLAYTHEHFNKLRTALGFKQDSELTELIEQSEAFRIVRNKETRQVVAFMSPLVRDRYVPTENQEIEEPPIPYGIFYCKANALANDNDRDKISENQRQHRCAKVSCRVRHRCLQPCIRHHASPAWSERPLQSLLRRVCLPLPDEIQSH